MSTLFRATTLLLIVVTTSAIVSAATDTTSYKVTSYVPVLFRDLQWTFTGALDLSGSGDHGYQPPSSSDYDVRDNSRSHLFQAASDLTRTVVTRASTLTTGFSTQLQMGGRIYGNRFDQRNAFDEYHDLDSVENNNYHYTLRLFGTYAPYITRDFFVSLNGSIGTNIVRTYDDDRWRETSSVDSADLTEVYWRHVSSHSEGNRSDENYDYTVTISAGWGRVYYGNYAATALYMIDELKKHGQLKSAPGYTVMDSLTEMIYQFRMVHAIDGRLRRIEALNAIGTFLRAHDISDMTDPIAQLYLQDIWDYFPGDSRPFGFQMRLGAGLSDYRYWTAQGSQTASFDSRIYRPYNSAFPADTTSYQSHWRFSYHYHQRSNEPYVTASVDWYRPVSLRTQLSANLAGSYFLDPYSFEDQTSVNRYHQYTASLSGSLDYILSSRTRARASSSLAYSTNESISFYLYYYDPIVRRRTDRFDYGLSGSLEYRIALPTTLKISLSYSGMQENYQQSRSSSPPRSTAYSYGLSASIVQHIY